MALAIQLSSRALILLGILDITEMQVEWQKMRTRSAKGKMLPKQD